MQGIYFNNDSQGCSSIFTQGLTKSLQVLHELFWLSNLEITLCIQITLNPNCQPFIISLKDYYQTHLSSMKTANCRKVVIIIDLSSIFRLSMKVAVNLNGYSARPAKTLSSVQRKTDIMRENVRHEHSTANTANWPSTLKTSRWEIEIIYSEATAVYMYICMNGHRVNFSLILGPWWDLCEVSLTMQGLWQEEDPKRKGLSFLKLYLGIR